MKADGHDRKRKGEPVEEGKDPEARDPEPDTKGGEESNGKDRNREEVHEAAEHADGCETGLKGERPSLAEPEKDAEGDASKIQERLGRENERLKSELEEMEDKHLRLRADFDNFRKRVNKEKANLIQYGNETLLLDLLPVVDNMERILAHSFQESGWEAFRRGVELVLTEIHDTLSKYGVQKIDAIGKEFDPNLHEAMQRVESGEAVSDTVVEEYQSGYLYRDRLLRPSRVMVAVAPKEEKEERTGEGEDSEASGSDKNDGKENKKIIQ